MSRTLATPFRDAGSDGRVHAGLSCPASAAAQPEGTGDGGGRPGDDSVVDHQNGGHDSPAPAAMETVVRGHDIKSIEAELMQMLETERVRSHERAMLLDFVQHDMANLVSRLTLAVAAMSLAAHEEEKGRWLAEVRAGLNRARDMLHGVRSITTRNTSKIHFQEGDLGAFLGGLTERLAASTHVAKVRFESGGECRATFCPLLLRQAVSNLVEYAIACSQGTWVRVALSPIRNGWWQVTVAHGRAATCLPGAPAAETRGQDGAGPGVAIARMCLLRHGLSLRAKAWRGVNLIGFAIPAGVPQVGFVPRASERVSSLRIAS